MNELNKSLAEKIADELEKEKLIDSNSKNSIIHKLTNGTLNDEEWEKLLDVSNINLNTDTK